MKPRRGGNGSRYPIWGLPRCRGVDGLHVFVRSLGTAGAKEGVSLDLLSNANEVLGSAVTDAMGYARFDAGLIRGTGGAAPALGGGAGTGMPTCPSCH